MAEGRDFKGRQRAARDGLGERKTGGRQTSGRGQREPETTCAVGRLVGGKPRAAVSFGSLGTRRGRLETSFLLLILNLNFIYIYMKDNITLSSL